MMKHPLSLLASLALIALLVSVSCAAKRASVSQGHSLPTKNNPTFTSSDSLKLFRYERVDVTPNGSTAAVYHVSSNNFGGYLYYRHLGSNTGWSYVVRGEKEPLQRLAECAIKHSIAREPYTPLDNEDKTRSRWMVRMVTTKGDTISVVHYPEGNRTTTDNQLDEDILSIIKPYITEATKPDNHGEFSRYEYRNGQLRRRIDYTKDNIVHGGWDADKPNACF